MVLTIGFSRSGSSLLGYLLTAHPNMIVADEPSITTYFVKLSAALREINKEIRPRTDNLYEANLTEMFDYILGVDHIRWKQASVFEKKKRRWNRAAKTRIHRYVYMPTQYQGRFKRLKVIGVKYSEINSRILSEDGILENLKKKLEERDILLKFIFTVRNPYDIFASGANARRGKMQQHFTKMCEDNVRILKQVHTRDVFISRHEDMVKDPSSQLTKLCDFLQVPISQGYLEACALWFSKKMGIKVPISQGYLEACSRLVAKELHRSRYKHDWTKKEKKKIASSIEKYDFFSGYDWES